MRVTEHLKKEHETISLMLTLLEKFSEKIQNREGIRGDDIERLFEGMYTFTYRCHHLKEETVLFPVLKQIGLPKQYRSVDEILEAHDLGRSYAERLSWGIAQYRADPQKDALPVVRHAKRYINFLNKEMEQEDHILFSLVDAALSAEKEAEMIKAFDRVEQENLGEDKGNAIHRLLDELSEVYLSGMESIQIDKEVKS